MKLKRLIAGVTAAALTAAACATMANAENLDEFFEGTYSYITISNDNYTATVKELAITSPCTITLNFACYNSEQTAGGAIPMPYSLDYAILLDTDDSNWVDNATPSFLSDGGDFETLTYTVTAEQISNAGGEFKLYCGAQSIQHSNVNIDNLGQKYHLSVNSESTDPVPYTKDVVGTYQSAVAPDTVYSVDIEWGSMSFTYTEAQEVWDPTKLKYVSGGGEWSCAEGANAVTVTNHSNATVIADVEFYPLDGHSDIAYKITSDPEGSNLQNSLELPTADSYNDGVNDIAAGAREGTLYFHITSGVLTEGTQDDELGDIKVILYDEERGEI